MNTAPLLAALADVHFAAEAAANAARADDFALVLDLVSRALPQLQAAVDLARERYEAGA